MRGVQRGGQLGEGAGEIRVKVPGIVWEGATVRTQQAGGLGIASGTWGTRGGSDWAHCGKVPPPCAVCRGLPIGSPTWCLPALHPHLVFPVLCRLKAPLPACPCPRFSPPSPQVLRWLLNTGTHAASPWASFLHRSFPHLSPSSSLRHGQHAPPQTGTHTRRPLPEPRNWKGLSRRSLSVSGGNRGARAPGSPRRGAENRVCSVCRGRRGRPHSLDRLG